MEQVRRSLGAHDLAVCGLEDTAFRTSRPSIGRRDRLAQIAGETGGLLVLVSGYPREHIGDMGQLGLAVGPCEDDPGRRLIWRTATGCRQPAWQIGAHLPATGSAGGPRRGRTMAQVFGPQPR